MQKKTEKTRPFKRKFDSAVSIITSANELVELTQNS